MAASTRPGSAVLPAFVDLDEAGRAELWAALALRHSPGIGPRTVRRLLAGFDSALAAVQAANGGGREWAQAGVRPHMAAPVAEGRWREAARQEWDAVRGCRCAILLWTDPRYPARLREVPDAPAVLYCRGDASLLANHAVAVVGSRLSSRAGRGVAADIAYSLSSAGVTVVSGLARGIDREAHVAALEEVGSTIGVLGTGIDVVYPPEHADVFERMESTGLLLSEYAPGTLPLPGHFPVRNRIISGLSVGVLVVEAAARSGSLITARLALEQGREVYAVPGPATAQYTCGCRGLIEQGARPVSTAEEVLADLAPVLGMELAALAAPCPPPGWDDDPLDDIFPADVPPAAGGEARPAAASGAETSSADHCSAHTSRAAPCACPDPRGAAPQGLKFSGESAVSSHDGHAARAAAYPVDTAQASARPANTANAGNPANPARPEPAGTATDAFTPATPGIPSPPSPKAPPASPAPAAPRKAVRSARGHRAAPVGVPAPVPASGGSPEDAILAFLRDRPGAHADDVCRALGLGAADVSARLVLLEVKGAVRRLPGMRYERM
ncbi:DNA-processing protein DprA [Nitratidesulfovibrio sp. HK-II]|uniref:DNA-processing protein DprA n=1 Tax=Nitratidesulfovibrio sp. HK-II TaxID=2009266 RepID=UPI000E2EC0E7|nr:DNA-processing protein DprA [Nitratidesulfovibrio sp. HK-II]GBO95600.1 rossmann fold nucleotide-binding protein Smf [Nitratidesulfovibrio sp. HK-II]